MILMNRLRNFVFGLLFIGLIISTVHAAPPDVTTSEKTVTVHPATYESGNRIWDEDAGMSDTYTWNPQSFSGFYYDLDSDEGSEALTIEDIDRSLGRGDIIYETSPISIDFEQDIWKTYEVIGFMADRYFAGYTDNTTFASSDESLLDERQLSKVLLDTDKKYNLRSGSSLELEEGYELRIAEFGSEGNAVIVALFKNGEKVTEDIVEEDDTFVYEKDLGDADDIPIIAIYFDKVFVGTETSTIIIEGIFQVSDNYIDVSKGDEFGLMEIDSVSSSGIKMENEDSVSLGKGDDFNLMGKINIIVADSSTLRFAPYVGMSKPGIYELRGTVTEETTFEWTPFNFEGLLYDINTGEGYEILCIRRDSSGDRLIEVNDLSYTTGPILKNFEHNSDGWNTFQSTEFMGDTYFAGYKSNSFVSSDRSLIKEGKLSKILIDEDKKHNMHIGKSLILEEGYSLRINEIGCDGSALMLALLKDGEEISTDIVSEGDTYIYEVDVNGTDIPIIVAHFNKISRGRKTNSMFIDGLFQISDSFTTVEKGDTYGIMEVTSFSSSSIVLKNEDSFSLVRGDTVNIMGDIKFKVADASDVRFYPFLEISHYSERPGLGYGRRDRPAGWE
jgi:S-layer protein (TIGR01567 family)